MHKPYTIIGDVGQFTGHTRRILHMLLSSAGIPAEECHFTSVFPFAADPRQLCGPKATAIPGYPALVPSRYLQTDYAPDLTRFFDSLPSSNILVACGALPLLALLRLRGIKKYRGAPAESPFGKVLPTYHPSAVNKNWKLQPVVYSDLCKAKKESAYPEVRRPHRDVWLDPTLADIPRFWNQHFTSATSIAIDIETKAETITCIGFAPSPSVALVIPFHDPAQPDGNYWRTAADEAAAWAWVRRICESPIPKIFQNGLYDMRYLWNKMGITTGGEIEDTMLLHHALQPEMEKGLAFLGTLYTDEALWKLERRSDTIKKEA